MDYLQWVVGAFLLIWGLISGYVKGYKDAKTEWYYRGKAAGRNASR